MIDPNTVSLVLSDISFPNGEKRVTGARGAWEEILKVAACNQSYHMAHGLKGRITHTRIDLQHNDPDRDTIITMSQFIELIAHLDTSERVRVGCNAINRAGEIQNMATSIDIYTEAQYDKNKKSSDDGWQKFAKQTGLTLVGFDGKVYGDKGKGSDKPKKKQTRPSSKRINMEP